MAEDGKDIGEGTSHRTDWEVVSLTESAYAAAPGPKGFDPSNKNRNKGFDADQSAYSGEMFMSGHFAFPSSDREDLQMKSDFDEIYNEPGEDQDVILTKDECDKPNKTHDDDYKTKSDDGLHGVQFSENNEKSPSVHNVEFLEGMAMQDLALVVGDQVKYDAPGFGDFHVENDISKAVFCDASAEIPMPTDPSRQNRDPVDDTSALKSDEGNKYDGSDLPCEAWWKRQANSLYCHVKETNTFWPVVVAVAVVGLAVLGHRWQREKSQIDQLKRQFNINNGMINEKMAGPIISRFQGVLLGGHQRSPLIHGSAASNQLGV